MHAASVKSKVTKGHRSAFEQGKPYQFSVQGRQRPARPRADCDSPAGGSRPGAWCGGIGADVGKVVRKVGLRYGLVLRVGLG